jgi:hypothetical protein
MRSDKRLFSPCARWFSSLGFMVILVGLGNQPNQAAEPPEEHFSSPDQAIQALVSAAKAKDTNAMHAIFGPAALQLISPDVVQAGQESEIFERRLTEKVEPVRESDGHIGLRLGSDGWPFPIPLVQDKGHWFFDTEAGRQEILNRRIGRDEINAIRVCRAYVEAQREYASQDRDGDEVLEYAQRLRSSPGTHDGLYWPVEPGGGLSPLGPLVAEARFEGYRRSTKILADAQSPYRGYYFKILTRQGKHAAGGNYNYIINGHMIAGFALVAWPAEWGNTGVMTFIVNQQGKVYQKSLGPRTAALAEKMTTYDPDPTWTAADPDRLTP